MTSFFEFIQNYGFLISLIGQVLLAALFLYFKDKFAAKKTEGDLDNLEDRVSVIETEMKYVPSKDDFHKLDMKISALQGDLKRVDESLVNVGKFSKLAQQQINRFDEFLKRV